MYKVIIKSTIKYANLKDKIWQRKRHYIKAERQNIFLKLSNSRETKKYKITLKNKKEKYNDIMNM